MFVLHRLCRFLLTVLVLDQYNFSEPEDGLIRLFNKQCQMYNDPKWPIRKCLLHVPNFCSCFLSTVWRNARNVTIYYERIKPMKYCNPIGCQARVELPCEIAHVHWFMDVLRI